MSKNAANEGCIGCIWIIVHLVALVFFFPALLVTVPLHIIHYSMEKNNNERL